MSRKILLADDSVTIQKVIELTFMDEDYEVKAVSNGDEALAALPVVSPDFVIADVHMPGANGYEVCRRSKELRPDIPVLLLVGTFEPFDEGQARAAGADSFLKKPFDSQELLQRVQDLLASHAAPAGGAAMPEMPEMPQAPAETLPPLDLGPAPFEQAASEPDWGSFKLEPELPPPFPAPPPQPGMASPFLEEESPFVFEDDHTAGYSEESPALPVGEPLFELESPAPRPAAGFGAPWTGEDTNPEERLGVPESAVPLVDSLAETEARIEAPPPPSITASHEPESVWSPPAEAEPWGRSIERPPLPPTIPITPPSFAGAPQPAAPQASPIFPPAPPVMPAAPLAVGSVSANGDGRLSHLSEEDVDRIARRVVELMGDKAVRDVAWEVVPDLAEVCIRDRLRELESQLENPAG